MSEEIFPVGYRIGKTALEYSFEIKILAKDEKTLNRVLEEFVDTMSNIKGDKID